MAQEQYKSQAYNNKGTAAYGPSVSVQQESRQGGVSGCAILEGTTLDLLPELVNKLRDI